MATGKQLSREQDVGISMTDIDNLKYLRPNAYRDIRGIFKPEVLGGTAREERKQLRIVKHVPRIDLYTGNDGPDFGTLIIIFAKKRTDGSLESVRVGMICGRAFGIDKDTDYEPRTTFDVPYEDGHIEVMDCMAKNILVGGQFGKVVGLTRTIEMYDSAYSGPIYWGEYGSCEVCRGGVYVWNQLRSESYDAARVASSRQYPPFPYKVSDHRFMCKACATAILQEDIDTELILRIKAGAFKIGLSMFR